MLGWLVSCVFAQNVGAQTCPLIFKKLVNKKFSYIHYVEKALGSENYSPELLVDSLEFDPQLRVLFRADAGVKEGFSVRDHSLQVLSLFSTQIQHFELPSVGKINIFRLLRITLALHDIGKPIAIFVDAEGKEAQHKYTDPIIIRVLKDLEFTEEEISIARAVILNSSIGGLLKQEISIDESYKRILLSARDTILTPQQYFQLQEIYFASAGSYTFLRENVFYEEGGKLIPKASVYQNLRTMIYR